MPRRVFAGFVWTATLIAVGCSSTPEQPPAIQVGTDGDGGPNDRSDAGGTPPSGRDGGIDPSGDGGSGERRLYTGGTRVKAKYYETTDGAFQFFGWIDTQLGLDCYFTPAADGKSRCVPAQGTAFWSANYFRDSNCTQPMGIYSPGCASPPVRYIVSDDRSGCPGRTRVYTVGARINAGTTAWYDFGNGCQQTNFSDNTEFYEIGAEVAATTFVGATEQVGPDLGGVARVDVVADDGARGMRRFIETTRNTLCTFRDAADATYRCLPGDAYVSGSTFTNASCSAQVASRALSACAAPPYAIGETAQGCGTISRVYAVGAPVATPYANGPSCVPLMGASGAQFYALGAEVPLATFGEGRVVVPGGTARVRAKELLLRGGEPYPSGLRDTQRNEDCYIGVAADGTWRCLPTSSASLYFFSDAQCTQRLAYSVNRAGCNPTPTLATASDGTQCPARTRVYQVGQTVSPPTIYVQLANQCLQTSTSGVTFYSVGAELPPSSFVQANIVQR
jgi:hypothetical protein